MVHFWLQKGPKMALKKGARIEPRVMPWHGLRCCPRQGNSAQHGMSGKVKNSAKSYKGAKSANNEISETVKTSHPAGWPAGRRK